MRSIVHLKFIQHFYSDRIYRLLAIPKLLSNLFAIESLSYQAQYLELLIGDVSIFHISSIQVINI